MTSDRDALIRAVLDEPDDDAPRLTDAGADALAAGSWSGLRYLAVLHNPLTEHGRALLANRFGSERVAS